MVQRGHEIGFGGTLLSAFTRRFECAFHRAAILKKSEKITEMSSKPEDLEPATHLEMDGVRQKYRKPERRLRQDYPRQKPPYQLVGRLLVRRSHGFERRPEVAWP
jgi:hypothetical protein